jgi:hypothetical protein
MFFTLLAVTLAVAAIVSMTVARIFSDPMDKILRRIIPDEISFAWHRYILFALFVVGISSGVRIWDLEKYITRPRFQDAEVVPLTAERWTLEVYRTIIETLQGLASVLLVFFIVALLGYLIVRFVESRGAKT